jgi:hypothetical protein
MQSKLLLCLALLLSGSFFGCAHPRQPTHADPDFSSVSEKIEHRIPELKSFPTAQTPLGWKCEKQINTAFFLRENPHYHRTGEFPREPATPLPYADMFVTIARFDSADNALSELKKSLRLRPATFRPPENYKGGTLFQYRDSTGGVQCAICQLGRYVVEIQCISQDAEKLTMNVLDTVLAEID